MEGYDDMYKRLTGESGPDYRWLMDNNGTDIDPVKLAEGLFKNSNPENLATQEVPQAETTHMEAFQAKPCIAEESNTDNIQAQSTKEGVAQMGTPQAEGTQSISSGVPKKKGKYTLNACI